MKQMTLSDLRQQSEQAVASPRLRAHRNFHPDLSDPVQRLVPSLWSRVPMFGLTATRTLLNC